MAKRRLPNINPSGPTHPGYENRSDDLHNTLPVDDSGSLLAIDWVVFEPIGVLSSSIQALIRITDNMFWIPYQWPTQQYFLLLKGADQRYEAFEAFYSRCLSGFGQPGSVAAAAGTGYWQTCFGLVIVTRNVFEILLEKHLEADSPTEDRSKKGSKPGDRTSVSPSVPV